MKYKLVILLIVSLLTLNNLIAQPTGDEGKYVKLSLRLTDKGDFINFIDSEKTLDTLISGNEHKLIAFTKNYKNDTMVDLTLISLNKNFPYKININKDSLFINYKAKFDWIDKYHSDLILFLKRKCKKMTVTFKIYETSKIDIEIPFKKGKYLVVDPEKPILIKE